MSLESDVARRVQSSAAQFSRCFDEVATDFFQTFGRQCPRAKAYFPMPGKRERYDFATSVARVIHSLHQPDQARAEHDRLRAIFASAQLTEQEVRIAQSALLGALRSAAGASWSSAQEADWSSAIHSVFSAAAPPAARRARVAA